MGKLTKEIRHIMRPISVLGTGAAVASLLFFSLPAAAQMYGSAGPPAGMPYAAGLWPEMMDDGSSSDFPVHMPGDFFAADRLNREVLSFNAAPPVYPGPR